MPRSTRRHADPSSVVWADSGTAATAVGLAEHLAGSGVRPGDRVLLLDEHFALFPIALLALLHLDVSVVLADRGLTSQQARQMLRTARVRWVLGGEGTAYTTERTLDGLDGVRVLDLVSAGWTTRPPGREDAALCLDAWNRRRDALLTWSSGTTGEPKTVVKSGRAVLDNCRASAAVMGYRRSDVLLPILPLTHQYGMSIVMIWWLVGCGLLVAPRERRDGLAGIAADAGATVVDSTAPVYHSLLTLNAHRPSVLDRLAGVRMWCVGGAPLEPRLAESFRRVTGYPLLDGYGTSETGNIALAARDRPVGCGPPLPGVQITVLDEDGEHLPVGVGGELAVSTPGLMEGYLGQDGALHEYGRSWYQTGDRGFLDAQRCVHVLGRNNAVHRMGHTLYPENLERQAAACGARVKVVPVVDNRRGCALVFVVEADEGDAHTWQQRMHDHLAPFERPNAVVVVPCLPLTGNGKVDAAVLARTARRSLT